MPKNTSNTKTSTTATYGQIQPESNKYIDAFANYQPRVDPTIGFRAGEAKRRLSNSFINPLGGYSTPQRDEAIRRAGERSIDEQTGMQTRAGMYDVNQSKMGQLGSLAALMAPRLVQTGSSGTSNTSQGQNLFGNLLDVGLGAANMAMT
jgi:hypothetical protein